MWRGAAGGIFARFRGVILELLFFPFSLANNKQNNIDRIEDALFLSQGFSFRARFLHARVVMRGEVETSAAAAAADETKAVGEGEETRGQQQQKSTMPEEASTSVRPRPTTTSASAAGGVAAAVAAALSAEPELAQLSAVQNST